ncbi:MAG: pectinesterase family protein [bacterium]|nr:pectinesterase family protein [bacterium]
MKTKRMTALMSALAVSAAFAAPFTISFAAEKTLSVGPDGDYITIHEAVEAAKAMNPQSEADRVTINVAPGTYEEQVRFDNAKFITLQQTPGTEGKVNLNWYYCTGYCTSNTDLNGLYDPTIDWSKDETWNGYNDGDEKFTKYEIGQRLNGNGYNTTTISYYDTNGVKHKDAAVSSQLTHLGALGWSYDKMAPLIVTRSSSDITVKDLNIVNSVPVMVTQGQLDGHLTPEGDRVWGVAASYELPTRDGLSVCSEDTVPVKPTADIFGSNGSVDKTKLKKYIDNGGKFDAGESAWLAQSSAYNERGHALATLGDRIIFENVRARGNQDSIWASDGRAYFKNCTLIGGTDYIYGSASAVFDNCKLGYAGFTDSVYGNPLTTPNTDKSRKYGYLFWNCTVYNECSNGGESNLGGPWGADGQATFYNTKIDVDGINGNSKVNITPKGWGRFDAENGLGRLYEYGTKTTKNEDVDLSKRIVNKSVEEGGQGMGTVLDQWQILEFNPRNYFAAECDTTGKWKDDWDPMNFSAELAEVDAAIAKANVTIPAGEATTVDLPQAPAGITYKWVSASSNAAVSADETKLSVIRPAAGEAPIETTVTLYAMDNDTKYGDKKDVTVTINPTTDTVNVFDIPVTIEQSANDDNTYTVTLTKNGALIKSVELPASGGVISGVPASAEGITYDVSVVSKSDEYTVTVPEDGKTTVTGVTGKNVDLKIISQKLVDESVSLDISAKPANGAQTYDLIALAKAAGASGIESSDIIRVTYDVAVNARPTANSYIDISSGTPSNANSAVPQRFTLAKINQSWVQIDTVDNSQGFSGSSNGGGQFLNVAGKFSYPTTQRITAVIDYKAQTVSIESSNVPNNADRYTFESFPNAAKGTLNMGVFPDNATDDWEVKNIKVTYKKVVTGDEPEDTPLPSGQGTYIFPADRNHVVNGNQCDANDTFTFVEGADARLAELLKDSSDSTLVNSEYTGHYLNYISGTNTGGSHPQITLEAPAGLYTAYLIGYNHGNNVQAIADGKSYTAEAGVPFAAKTNDSSYILKSYKIDIEVNEKNDVITFDSTDSWLPDTYIFVVDARQAAPEPVPAEAEAKLVSASTDLEGANAASYMAEFENYTGKLNTISWKIEKADKSAAKTTDAEKFADETVVTNTTVVVGLVITTNEQLDTIGTVTAIIE